MRLHSPHPALQLYDPAVPFADVVAHFRRVVEQAAEWMLTVAEGRAGARPAPGKWSAKEIVGHLVDSACNNHGRFVRAQLEDDLVFPGYAQDDWVRLEHFDAAPWPELVALWRAYNLHVAHVMAHVPEGARTRSRARHNLHQIAWRTVPESEPATLEYLMRDYVGHLEHHLRQIGERLKG